ncbi:MAG: hypothetical protein FWC73_14410 [Defluviitaleaceae bacterium]|nr:hypothetical protein [Defluviitaleaceae bacterium]
MDSKQPKILVLVEGARREKELLAHLLEIYGIPGKFEIVSYCLSIYELYDLMFRDKNPDEINLLMHLRSREANPIKKLIFNENYAEILLIFDFDPHYRKYSDKAIREMVNYFTESTDMGKLYINYPMIEAFYHMRSIPDTEYNTYVVPMSELHPKNLYKQRVNNENRNRDYSKFAIDRHECTVVIQQNIDKAWILTRGIVESHIPEGSDILEAQLKKLCCEDAIAVLCTCAFYIYEYNPRLLEKGATP